MQKIENISNDPLQQQTLILDSGATFTLTLQFKPNQLGWFITELAYGDFTLNGLRVSNQPNMLYQWRNILPFGLGCFSTANREPMLIDDFQSGASVLYILSEDEVDEYTEFLNTSG